MTTAKLIESIRNACGHGYTFPLSPREGLALTDEIARLTRERDEATGEFHRLRARLRRTAQILVNVLGADGPKDAETMAEAAAAEIVARRASLSNRLLEQARNEGIGVGAEEGYGRGLTDGASEERAAVVAWLRTDEPYRTWGESIGGTELSCATNAIEAGKHIPKRTRPTEPPPVVVVRREVGDE